MPKERSLGSPTTRRYRDGEKADTVRLVRTHRLTMSGADWPV